MRIIGKEIIEDVEKILHLDVYTAYKLVLPYICQDELSEDIFNKILGKLSDEEKELFIAMLVCNGIKVVPLEIKKNSETKSEVDIREEVEKYKKQIIELITEKGEISEIKLQQILDSILDKIVKMRIIEWLVTTPFISKIKLKNNEQKQAENEYRKRVKRKVKKITGSEVFYDFR